MIKQFYITLLLLGIVQIAAAQEIAFELSASLPFQEKLKDRSMGIEPVGLLDNHLFFLFQPYQAYYADAPSGMSAPYHLGKYDAEMKLVKKNRLDLTQGDKDKDFQGLVAAKGKLILFSSFQNTKDKKHYFFAQNVNTETVQVENNIKLIGELDYSGLNKFSRTIFHHEVSEDGSHLLIFYTLLNKNNEPLRSGIYVYDHTLNLKWKLDNVSAKISSGVFGYEKFAVDNWGNVFLLGLHYEDRENYFDSGRFKERGFFSSDTYFTDKPNYTHQLYRYSDSGKKEDVYELKLPEKFIRNFDFKPTTSSTITCTGVYSSPGTISAAGAFSFTYNLTSKKLVGLSTKAFGNELISQGFDESQLKRFKRSMDNKEEWDPFEYLISDLKTKKNGEKYFMAEQYIRGTKTVRSGNTVSYIPIHLHKDIFVVSLSSTNQISRIDKISKTQYTLGLGNMSSYACFEKNGKLYFTYNTYTDSNGLFTNVEIGDSELVALDSKGKQRKSVLKTYEKGLPLPTMQSNIVLKDNSLVYSLMTNNYKTFQFNKLVIKE